MKVSFIIPSYNNCAGVHHCIQSIEKQDISGCPVVYEIIVALDRRDNEFTAHAAQCSACQACLNVRAEIDGANAARNAGIHKAAGDIFSFIDNDCFLPDQTWLRRLYDRIQACPNIKAFGGNYLSRDTLGLVEQCRNALANQFLAIHTGDQHGSAVLLGGASSYRKEVFSLNGYFDETIVYGSAETEFNDRLLKTEDHFYCGDDLSVFHHPIKKKRLTFIVKSFFQGKGYAYSLRKNKILKQAQKKMTITAILENITKPDFQKFNATFIILLMMIAFKTGVHWQKLFGSVPLWKK